MVLFLISLFWPSPNSYLCLSIVVLLHRLGTLYYSRFICKLTYHNIFTGNNGMNLLSNYLIDMYPQHLIHSSVPSGLPNFVSIIDNSSISNKMLSCDLESIVFLKPSKVQQSENQESKFDNKWLRSRRNHGYVLYDTTTLHSTRSKIAKLPKCCVLKKFWSCRKSIFPEGHILKCFRFFD